MDEPGRGPAPAYVQQTNGLAIASLVLGIAGVTVLPVIGPILALVFGYSARREIDAGGGVQGGRQLAVAGIVLGWVGVALMALIALAFIALIPFVFIG